MKAQSAIEYLLTYGWAILIIMVVIGALYSLGVFNASLFAPSICAFPADFGCSGTVLLPNGIVVTNIEQSTSSPIYITAVGCNDASNTANMLALTPAYLQIGNNATFSVQCYVGGNKYSGQIGALYTGYYIFNYTDVQTGFQHVIIGRLIQKVV